MSTPSPAPPAPLASLARALRQGDARAVDLIDAALAAASAAAPVGAFLHLDPEGARAAARRADDRLAAGDAAPLLGIPFAVKDNIAVAGQPLTCGAPLLAGHHPSGDATLVARLRAAGAIPLGKTNLDAFGMGASTEHSAGGPTRHPLSAEHSPGGSSGGSAVAVALGIVPFALGSDTGGSVRQPAAHCGVVGFKPTYGTYSRSGLVAFASSLDQVGILCRSASDLPLLHPLLAGSDPRDSTCLRGAGPIPPEPPLRGLRLAHPEPRWLGRLHPAVARAFAQTLKILESEGATLASVPLPDPEGALAAYHVLSAAEAASNLARYDGVRYGRRAPGAFETPEALVAASRGAGLGIEVKRRILLGTWLLGAGRGHAYYHRALLARRAIAQALEGALAGVDGLLTPTTPTPPFRLGARLADPVEMYRGDTFTAPVSLGGLPALSIPMGRDEAGFPLGLQVVGALGADGPLFALAQSIEGALAAAKAWEGP